MVFPHIPAISLVLITDLLCADAVCAAVFHPSGAVLATCSGQRHFSRQTQEGNGPESQSEDDNDSDKLSSTSSSSSSSLSTDAFSHSASLSEPTRTFDNSLKIWAL
jgi:hypothetical protein